MESLDNNCPLISVITVSYNSVETIEQTIISVLNQSYKNIEYIIIDGGSIDGTCDIIRKYSGKLKYFISEKDNGIYDAMNKGVIKSSGILIGILNSDDWYEIDAIETIVSSYIANGQFDIYHGMQKNINNDGSVVSITGYSSLLLPHHMIQHPTCFIKKELYTKQCYYSKEFKFASDYDFILRSYFSGVSFLFVDKVITNFRLGGSSSRINALIEDYRIKYNFKVINAFKYLIWITYLKVKKLIL